MGQQTSDLWKQIYQMRGTVHQYMFDINGTIYGPESEVSHSVSNGLYEEFGIGNASSAKLTLSLYADQIPRAAVIKRFIRLVNKDAGLVSEWIPKGVFFTNRRTEDDGLWTIDAFDAMRKAERLWVPAGDESAFPMTMPDVVEELAGLIGVQIDSRTILNPAYTIDEYPYDDDYSIRDMLRYIAAAHGGNWIITDLGKLLLVPLFSAPPDTAYLITENGDPITFGLENVRLIVGNGGTNQSSAAAGAFSKYYVGLDMTGLQKNSVQRPVSKVTLNGYVVKRETAPEYTRLEYIESTGTQFIDAGFVPSNTTDIIADFEILTDNGTWAGIFGSKTAGANFSNAFCLWVSPQGFRDDYYDSSVTFSKTASGRHKIRKKYNETTIDGTKLVHEKTDFISDKEFLIFSIQNGAAADSRMLKARLYSFKAYDFGEKILDLIPIKNENGEIGLYDLVSESFYGNVGTGEFIAGAETTSDGSESRKTAYAYTAGDDTGMEIEADCPFATQEMVAALLQDFKGGKYEMYSADDVNVDPAAELGDGIGLGNIYSVIARVDDDGTGWPGLSQPGKTELEDEYPYESPEKRKRKVLEKKVENLEQEIQEIGDMLENLGVEAGVISFNGRTGIVVPEVGDYTDEIAAAIKYAIIESWNTEY